MKIVLAIVCAIGALVFVIGSPRAAGQGTPTPPGAAGGGSGDATHGRTLFVESCSSCHGLDAGGVSGRGPSLHGVGARAADFYLSTGRMPLDDPGDQPFRHDPAFKRSDIDDLVAYVASLGGPPIPPADPARGSISEGFRAFSEHCAGCHQIAAEGGITTGARVPGLQDATPTQVAEAVRIGPYVMPKFSEAQLDQHEVDSLAKYIEYTRSPRDEGGWGIGHIGPIPEGMVAWLLGLVSLILVIRVIGERAER